MRFRSVLCYLLRIQVRLRSLHRIRVGSRLRRLLQPPVVPLLLRSVVACSLLPIRIGSLLCPIRVGLRFLPRIPVGSGMRPLLLLPSVVARLLSPVLLPSVVVLLRLSRLPPLMVCTLQGLGRRTGGRNERGKGE
ncbi:hypothetical protein RchiOBHm_Chr4g0430401 [Rosa chinensis]|uniref:Uncharacterized protein n=1 Tax=Rosa chinensis TaxID=74649 RepID=A0A2P6R0F4_ROSCH|nr:hypothetical protein RchiOBHm_Chr4g0430401 [Rosa chinensis]